MNQHRLRLDDYLDNPEDRLEYERIMTELAQQYRESSPFCMEFYQKRGIPPERAHIEMEAIRNRMRKTPHPTTIEHFVQKGATPSEAIQAVENYKRSIGKTPNREDLLRKWGDQEGTRRWEEYQSRYAARQQVFLSRFTDPREAAIMQCLVKGFGKTKTCPLSYENFSVYAKHCRLLTNMVILAYRDVLDPEGNKLGRSYGKNGFSLDHKFSIYGGFFHRVEPMKICSVDNLRLITCRENSTKSQFCVIPLAEVMAFKTLLDEDWLSEDCKERIRNVYCR